VLTFLFGALTAALEPTVARLHAAGERAGLAATVAGSAGSTFLLSAGLALALAVAGPAYLGLFGPGFAAGYPAFLVLLLGWLACIACGPAQVVLLMTGEARAAALLFAGGTGLNLTLALALIPLAGPLGAALASAAAVALTGLGWGRRCRRRLGLRVDGLAALGRRGRPAPLALVGAAP
jgi:O-antigen/teichoic acid export membrane protein